VAAVIVLALDSRNSRLLSITPTIADHSDWTGASTTAFYQIIRVDLPAPLGKRDPRALQAYGGEKHALRRAQGKSTREKPGNHRGGTCVNR
jgi:hypothetical protein